MDVGDSKVCFVLLFVWEEYNVCFIWGNTVPSHASWTSTDKKNE